MKDGIAVGSCSIACRVAWKGRSEASDSQGSGAGQIPSSEKASWIPSLGRLSSPIAGRPCPQTISFPLSTVATDLHLHLIGRCLLPHFLPLVSLPFSTPASQSICPSVSFVRSSSTSTRFPSLRLFFRRSLFHIARGRFRTNSTFLCYTIAWVVAVSCTHTVRTCASAISRFIHSPYLLTPPPTAPFLTIPYGLAVS